MKNKWLSLVLIVIGILFFQCHKEASFIGNPDPGIPVNPSPITANIQGNIFDENDQPAPGVSVTAGPSSAITDANGFFHINAVSLDKNTSLVTAQKDGYFKAYRVFAATSGCNQVVIKLIKRNIAGTIKSSSGGDVSLIDGSKISLPANAVVNTFSGSDYSGDVKVYASYINPRAGDISKTVPGSFVANDKNGKRVFLSSYGMLAIDLESSNGEKLQIKQGDVATLTIPISSSAIASAPASISLWYVDEQTGIWQEEGTATKNGNAYTGTVKHFSFWNCDYPMDAVNLSMTLKTPDDLPLVNAEVRVTATADSAGSAYGWTDSLGQVKGLVPVNENLKIEVLDQCENAVYSKDVSPLSKDDDLGVIKIPNGGSATFVTIKGNLINCEGLPVTNGYVMILYDNYTRYLATDSVTGDFNAVYLNCTGSSSGNSTIIGIDNDAQQQSSSFNLSITSATNDAGLISTCGTSSKQYVSFKIDNTIYGFGSDSLLGGFAYGGGGHTEINGPVLDPITSELTTFIFDFEAQAIGTFPLIKFYIRSAFTGNIDQPSTITLTKFPASIGEFYEGSLEAKFTDSVTHKVTGTFRIRRYE